VLWKANSDFNKLFLFVPFFPFSSGYARREPNPVGQISTWPPQSTSRSEAAELRFGGDKGSARRWQDAKAVGADAF